MKKLFSIVAGRRQSQSTDGSCASMSSVKTVCILRINQMNNSIYIDQQRYETYVWETTSTEFENFLNGSNSAEHELMIMCCQIMHQIYSKSVKKIMRLTAVSMRVSKAQIISFLARMQILLVLSWPINSPCLLQVGTSCYRWNRSWIARFLDPAAVRWWAERSGGLEAQEASSLGESAWVRGVWWCGTDEGSGSHWWLLCWWQRMVCELSLELF